MNHRHVKSRKYEPFATIRDEEEGETTSRVKYIYTADRENERKVSPFNQQNFTYLKTISLIRLFKFEGGIKRKIFQMLCMLVASLIKII